jgi:hypothetical protein
MTTTNINVSAAVVEEVSTLGVVSDDDHLLEVDEEDFPQPLKLLHLRL